MVGRQRTPLVLVYAILVQISSISCDGGENVGVKYGEVPEQQADISSMENLLTDMYLNDLLKNVDEEYGKCCIIYIAFCSISFKV